MHKTVVPAHLPYTKTFSKPVTQSIFSSCGEGKNTARTRKVMPLFKATEIKLDEFYQKKELEENQSEKHRIKRIVLVLAESE